MDHVIMNLGFPFHGIRSGSAGLAHSFFLANDQAWLRYFISSANGGVPKHDHQALDSSHLLRSPQSQDKGCTS